MQNNALPGERGGPSMLGRYRIVSEIGQGAMGTVYKAIDPLIDRTVAIKTINLNLSRAEIDEYAARFQQEIKAAGRLNHPNIVILYDVGSTDRVAYMAMELLEGRELKEIIASGNLPAGERTVDILAQIADGLSFAHLQGVVHRDVKPSNIMVLDSGVAKITDFGIARLPDATVRTSTGMILGSPRYMSPEQATGKEIDARSDIFSLGVVLYEALTGVVPFDGVSANAAMHAIMNATPAPPSSRNAAVPAMLDFIVAKALAKAADDRYQTIKELGDDLREAKRRLEAARPLQTHGASAPPAATSQAVEPAGKPSPDARVDRAALQQDGSAPALSLDQTFDSFDATVRLAAMTDQTAEFGEYISITQKMRAYQAADDASAPIESSGAPVVRLTGAGLLSGDVLLLAAIVILSIVALGLAVALVR